jgi:gliding motility-associated-like protein
MRKLLVSALFLIPSFFLYAQDFSNKGKEFWLCFPSHTPSGNSLAKMGLFITSDKNSAGTITVNGFSTTFNVSANQVAGPIDIPYNAAHINPLESGTPVNKGIHVKVNAGQPAVVVYAHMYAGFRSAASLILPVATLGKNYYSANFWQASTAGSLSQFQIIATEANTVVRIKKRKNGVLDATFSTPVNLANPGDVLQIQENEDLTGSIIESVASGLEGCKRIAVFSGSSALSIGRPGCTGGSFDPLFQQLYPVNTWGKEYGVIPFANNRNGYHVRVIAAEDNTSVRVGGLSIALNKGEFFPATSASPGQYTDPMVIKSDKPVSVVQYMMSAVCANGNGTDQGDPDMVVLNPVEQNIRDISIFSSSLQAVNSKFLSVYMKTDVAPSFKINGAAPNGAFIPIVPNNGYSYLVEDISSAGNSSRLTADSGFNAIAYGLGNFESYGYSAGTNLKDIYQYVTLDNDLATVNFPAGCKNSPFKFSMTFPYQPVQIKWEFGVGLNAIGLTDTTITNPVADSVFVVDGKTLYRYKLKRTYVINTIGTYPIKVIANNPSPDGCSGEQEIEYDLQIFDPPVAAFSFANTGCITDPVLFNDQTTTSDPILNPVQKWYWDFGDGGAKGDKKKDSHNYTAGGSYPVKFAVLTAVGCLSDTARQTVDISDPPLAKFSIQSLSCEKSEVTFRNESTVPTGNTLKKWYWDFGDGVKLTKDDGSDVKHVYAVAGPYNVKLEVETSTGCKSIAFAQTIAINPQPKPDFTLPGNLCLPTGRATFTNTSTISDGTAAQFIYLWNFGDGASSPARDPVHNYITVGPFTVKLKVTSKDGCTDSVSKQLTTVYPQPIADFDVSAEVCLGTATIFTDKSDGKGTSISQYQWDFDDGQTVSGSATTHTYATARGYNPRLIVTTDKGCASAVSSKPTLVNLLPVADFAISGKACANKQISFTDISNPGAGTIAKWNWNFDDGTSSTDGNPVHTFTSVKTYNVSLNVESSKGCKSGNAVTKPVPVNYLPQPNFGSPEVCLNDPQAQFSDSSKIADGTEAQFTYLWNFDLANNPAATGTGKNPVYSYTVAKDYLVKLTVTSKDGCVKDTVKTFTVNGAIPKADFTINSPASLCSNKDVTITDASSVDFGKVVKVEIYWDYQNNPLAKTVEDEPTPGKVYTHKYPDFGFPRTRSFEVRYVAYSGINCVNQFSRTIVVNATPAIQFDAMQPVCQEIPAFQLTAARETFGFTGVGSFSGPGVSAAGIFNPTSAKPGLHTIKYSFTADNGCKTEGQETIRVHPTPLLDAGPDRYLLEGGYGFLQAKASGDKLSYLWTPATYLDNAFSLTPKINAIADIRYKITATSADGCVAADSVDVKILKALVVPNAFTPNGDGINDTWLIEYLESYPGATVQVYNRYGQLVFNSNGYPKAWNGTVNGNPLPIGTYYWIINPKNGRSQINGSVTIIR